MFLPQEVAKNYSNISKKKLKNSSFRLFLLGIFAGAFIALAAAGANTAASTIENPAIAKLVAGCIFPAGLAMVIFAGSELFTSNCMLVISVFEKELSWSAMLKSWFIVYTGNFAGAVSIAWLIYKGNQLSLFTNRLALYTLKVSISKITLSFENALILGILCNILVCVAVWISYAGENTTEKMTGIFFPVLLFVLMGFEHSVANMYYIPAGLFAKTNEVYQLLAIDHGLNLGELSWLKFFVQNLLPVTIGNIIGGAILIGGGYWVIYLKNKE